MFFKINELYILSVIIISIIIIYIFKRMTKPMKESFIADYKDLIISDSDTTNLPINNLGNFKARFKPLQLSWPNSIFVFSACRTKTIVSIL